MSRTKLISAKRDLGTTWLVALTIGIVDDQLEVRNRRTDTFAVHHVHASTQVLGIDLDAGAVRICALASTSVDLRRGWKVTANRTYLAMKVDLVVSNAGPWRHPKRVAGRVDELHPGPERMREVSRVRGRVVANQPKQQFDGRNHRPIGMLRRAFFGAGNLECVRSHVDALAHIVLLRPSASRQQDRGAGYRRNDNGTPTACRDTHCSPPAPIVRALYIAPCCPRCIPAAWRCFLSLHRPKRRIHRI